MLKNGITLIVLNKGKKMILFFDGIKMGPFLDIFIGDPE